MFKTFTFEHFSWLANQQIADFSGEALDEYRCLSDKKIERKDLEPGDVFMLPHELNGIALYALTCVFFQAVGNSLWECPWWFEEHFFNKKNDFLSCLSADELSLLAGFFEKSKITQTINSEVFENLNMLLEQARLREKLLAFSCSRNN